MHLKAACIQICSGPEIDDNLKMIEPMIREAHNRGADLIMLPENVSMMPRGRDKILARAKSEADHPAIPFFKRMASETKTWIVGGTLAIVADGEKLANRTYVFNPEGEIAAYYDKIHMFDADVGPGEAYHESATYRGGKRAVTVDSPWGKIGLSICYDMRFPHLYRALAKAGATIITAPSAYTVPTGKLHWHVLVRARAIETGAFLVAPGQCGTHDGGRMTYGHSLIVGPLGEILSEGGDEPAIIIADLDLNMVTEARRMLPSLQHDCAFQCP